jgi:L-lactate utilization protein LutC
VIGVPSFYAEKRNDTDTNIDLFCRNWAALGGKAHVVERQNAAEGIWEALRQTVEEHGVKRLARWDDKELESLGLDERLAAAGVTVVPWREMTAEAAGEVLADVPLAGRDGPNWTHREPLLRATEACQLGLVAADYAIANTSTLALMGQGGHGRSVSLVVDILFAVIPAERLVTRMGEVFQRVKAAYGVAHLPSTINFVTGPSRSADIENDLTIGVHGPGKVVAVIVKQ